MLAKIGTLWEILAQKTVRVLIASALPRALRVTEVDVDTRLRPQFFVLSHLCALIPEHVAPKRIHMRVATCSRRCQMLQVKRETL
jgi:hypothetical protein